MELHFEEYRARKIVNVHRHVDGAWFWDKYTAHPYIGCRHNCEFCYSRGGPYLAGRDPDTFHTKIKVKTNAAELLRRELAALPLETIACGDWQQPAESRYRLSRGMMEVVLERGFPLFIVERSPLLLRDLDLLTEINRRAGVNVAFSFSNVDPALKRAFEPHSPGIKRRLAAMAGLAAAGINVGAALMPVIPFLGDRRAQLEKTIKAVKDHGGTFILAAGMTMAGIQAQRTLAAARLIDPAAEESWRQLYSWGSDGEPAYAPPRAYNTRLGRAVREICSGYSLADRMPRLILPGPLAGNKRLAEKLFNICYELELAEADERRIWAYRKAAWAVDEWPADIAGIYRAWGEEGLKALPGIGASVAAKIAAWLREMGSENSAP